VVKPCDAGASDAGCLVCARCETTEVRLRARARLSVLPGQLGRTRQVSVSTAAATAAGLLTGVR
jgi:hypothetical protein